MNNSQIEKRLEALERAHQSLMEYVLRQTNWQPSGCDDEPPGMIAPRCDRCGEHHKGIAGCAGPEGDRGLSDSDILDALEHMKLSSGYRCEITIHDSSDMGYRKNFVSVDFDGKYKGKGNSLREALAHMISEAGLI